MKLWKTDQPKVDLHPQTEYEFTVLRQFSASATKQSKIRTLFTCVPYLIRSSGEVCSKIHNYASIGTRKNKDPTHGGVFTAENKND